MEYHSIFDLVGKEFKAAKLSYALIGGFAINAYGVSRNTGDIDFLVDKADYPQVLEILKKADYKEAYGQDSFARLQSSKPRFMDLDCVFVEKETLQEIIRNGRKIQLVGNEFVVPSLEHLIALKLHAIKNNPKLREFKDLPDIIRLIRKNNMDVHTKSFRDLCSKFGPEKIYQKILEAF